MQTRVNRRKFIVSATCSICGSVILPSCAQVPLTNRNQLNLYDSNLPIVIFQGSVAGIPIPKVYANEKSLNQEIDKVYNKFISQAKNDKILVDNTAESKKIKEIGTEIYSSINKYYQNNNQKNPIEDFKWQFALIESEQKNAWCMPGGKIAFYTGILPICKNDDGIAAVMGHEIAHAFARHTVEKLTQSSMIQMATIGISNSRYSQLLNRSFRIGNVGGNVYNSVVKYGIFLPFSRNMESEADYLGMGFMNLAGFNIKEPAKLWQRMMAGQEGRVPEFMGSHPSPDNRSKKFLEWESEILDKFPQV
jgi:predicted Zn-dependent protease